MRMGEGFPCLLEKQNQLYYGSVILFHCLNPFVDRKIEADIAMLEAQCFGFVCPETETQKQGHEITAESGIVLWKRKLSPKGGCESEQSLLARLARWTENQGSYHAAWALLHP